MRKTKIVCTLGPASDSEEMVSRLMDAGMNVCRLNMSHGSYEEQAERIARVKRLRAQKNIPVAILLDTKGPEVRTKTVEGGKVTLEAGSEFVLTSREIEGNAHEVSITYPRMVELVRVGTRVLIDDGLLAMEVVRIENGTDIVCSVTNGGVLGNRKGISVPEVDLQMPSIGEKDRSDIIFGIEQGIDLIAASFVCRPSDVLTIRKLCADNGGSHVQIFSKIENRMGVDNFDDILKVSDGIMVARGDLGVEVDMEEVPVLQKQFIHKCNVAAKPVITATQMLDSMIRNPRPTRAEASDVANAIIDGTDAIMLSGETAAGKYPVEAVNTMVRIASYIETRGLRHNGETIQHDVVKASSVRTVANAVSYACCAMAEDLGAAAIITPSNSGTTARMVARFHPDCPVIAPTTSEHTYHQLGLCYGVVPARMEMSENTDEMISTAVDVAYQADMVKTGDIVVVAAGVPTGVSGTTNLIKAHIVGNVLLRGVGVGAGRASGQVCSVNTLSDLESGFKDGAVIVTKMTSSDMLPYLRKASAVVVESTDENCHAAVACQALGLPLFMDRTGQACHMLKSGMLVTVDAEQGFIFNGIV
ncbi:MAG: pyruvate kinase [Clostridiales bacterium]|nr:pyruvate kinase [Clostridiales bacterium]